MTNPSKPGNDPVIIPSDPENPSPGDPQLFDPAAPEPGADPDPNDPGDPTPENPVEWPEGLEVPKRLQGKSLEDIAKEFSSLHSDYGRLGQEVGDLRSLVRDRVLQDLKGTKTEPDPEEDLDPEEQELNQRVSKAVEKAVAPLVEEAEKTKVAQGTTQLEIKHPGFQETVNSTEFKEWVSASKYRQAVYARANLYDFSAAEELLNGFEEVSGQAEQQAGADRTRKVRSKAGVKGGGAGSPRAKGKFYKEADIRRLIITNPQRYNELLPDFQKAYEEGRVVLADTGGSDIK